MVAVPNDAETGRPLRDLASLVESVQSEAWPGAEALAKQLRHRLARNIDGAKSFVVGGGSATSGNRRDFIHKVVQWVEPRSACLEGAAGSWLVEANGPDMHSVAEKVIASIMQRRCAVTLLVIRDAHQADSAALQALEPMLSGEAGEMAHHEVIVLFDVVTSSVDPDDCLSEALQHSQLSVKRGAELQSEASTQSFDEERQRLHFICAQQQLQHWVSENVWKRKGLVGRITMWIPI